jgi:simple sugar transport system substrate-binding protein
VKKVVVILALFAVVVAGPLFAQAPKSGAPKYTFYAMGVDAGIDPFFATVLKGMKAAEADLPIKLNYVGLRGNEITAAGLGSRLEQAVAAKPDGIITGFWFADSEKEITDPAMDKGISIMAYNNPDTRSEKDKAKYIGYIGMDERYTGQVLASSTVKRIKAVRAVIGINTPGSTPIENRASGIAKVLDENKIPYEKLNVTDDPATCATVLGAYLTKYPDTNLIFVMGPVSAHPALQLLQDRNLQGKVFIACFDASQKIIDGISSGAILNTAIQQPFAQGYLSVMMLYLYKEYGILPPDNVPTGPTIVDKSNLKIIQKQITATGGA